MACSHWETRSIVIVFFHFVVSRICWHFTYCIQRNQFWCKCLRKRFRTTIIGYSSRTILHGKIFIKTCCTTMLKFICADEILSKLLCSIIEIDIKCKRWCTVTSSISIMCLWHSLSKSWSITVEICCTALQYFFGIGCTLVINRLTVFVNCNFCCIIHVLVIIVDIEWQTWAWARCDEE